MSNASRSCPSAGPADSAPPLNTTLDLVVTHLQAECGVRYWEDAIVNGIADENGDLIPLRYGACWRPLIELKTGRIAGWPAGTVANIHYKVCDSGRYGLLNADGFEVCAIEGYVPAMMSPGGQGYGDYVIMHVLPDGVIEGWKIDLSDFEDAMAEVAARVGPRVAAGQLRDANK